jgi:hypothetical protein
MKLKIISLNEKQPAKKTFTTGKGTTGYNYDCQVSADGGETHYGRVVTYTDKLQVVAGAEFAEAKYELKNWNGNTYEQYTIFAPKSSWPGNTKREWTPPAKISWNEYKILCHGCWSLANEISKEHAVAIFDKILGCASVCLDFTGEQKKKEDDVKNRVNDLNKKVDDAFPDDTPF